MESNGQQHESAAPEPAAAAEAGRHDSGYSPERPVQSDSPLAADAGAPESPQDPNSADWRYLYAIVRERCRDERIRADELDQKTGVLLAGAIASIAFTYANGPTGWWSLVLLVFLLPLWHLYQAFCTRLGKDAPDPEILVDSFPYYPQTILRVAAGDMAQVHGTDRALNDTKADRLDWAMTTLAGAFIVVLFVQIAWRITQTQATSGCLTGASLVGIANDMRVYKWGSGGGIQYLLLSGTYELGHPIPLSY